MMTETDVQDIEARDLALTPREEALDVRQVTEIVCGSALILVTTFEDRFVVVTHALLWTKDGPLDARAHCRDFTEKKVLALRARRAAKSTTVRHPAPVRELV